MTDYKRLYIFLFNKITDAIEMLEFREFSAAKELLKNAQIETEEMYLQQEEERKILLFPCKKDLD